MRNGTSAFQETFSDVQKAGLKDHVKRLAKADVVLQQEEKTFDQSVSAKAAGTDLKAQASNLDRALADFYNQQLALGRAMSIVIASGNDVAFTLPTVRKSVQLNGVAITIPVSAALEQTATSADHRRFKLEMAVTQHGAREWELHRRANTN